MAAGRSDGKPIPSFSLELQPSSHRRNSLNPNTAPLDSSSRMPAGRDDPTTKEATWQLARSAGVPAQREPAGVAVTFGVYAEGAIILRRFAACRFLRAAACNR